MSNKTFFALVALLCLVVIGIAKCATDVDVGTDGIVHIAIPYEIEGESKIIAIRDTSDTNGIYVDIDNYRMVCPNGQLINLPKQSRDESAYSHVRFNAEEVCTMGQERFEQVLRPFNITFEN